MKSEVNLHFIVLSNEMLYTISFQCDWSFGLFSQHRTDAIIVPVGVTVRLATCSYACMLAVITNPKLRALHACHTTKLWLPCIWLESLYPWRHVWNKMYQALLLLTVGRVWELALSCSYLRTMQRNYLGCDATCSCVCRSSFMRSFWGGNCRTPTLRVNCLIADCW